MSNQQNDQFDEAVNEALEEQKNKELPESPISSHIDAYYKGFHVGITQRDPSYQEDVYKLIKNSKDIVELIIKDGWKPSWNEDTNAQIGLEEYTCDFCKAKAIMKSGKSKTGKDWKGVFCTQNKEHVTWL